MQKEYVMTDDPQNIMMQAQNAVQAFLDWLDREAFHVLAATLVALALFIVLRGALHILCRRFDKNALGSSTSWPAIFAAIIRKTSNIFLLFLAIEVSAPLAQPPAQVTKTLGFLFTIAVTLQVAIWVRELILGLISRRATTEDEEDDHNLSSAMGVIRVIINLLVWALALLVILDNVGVNVTALIAGLGVGGIAIGLAAQGIFSDLFAALSILFDKPFKRGEVISFGQVTGQVEAIGLKTTRLRAISGEEVVISNANLLNQELHNLSRIEARRVVMVLNLIYQTQADLLQRVPQLLQDIVSSHKICRFDRAYFHAFSPSSIDFELVFFVESPDMNRMTAERHAIALEIVTRFAQEGIDFAYPAQVSYLAGPDGKIMPVAEQRAPDAPR